MKNSVIEFIQPGDSYKEIHCRRISLSYLLNKAVRNGIIEGIDAVSRRSRITHLFFEDDSLFFFVELIEGIVLLFQIFYTYINKLRVQKLTSRNQQFTSVQTLGQDAELW